MVSQRIGQAFRTTIIGLLQILVRKLGFGTQNVLNFLTAFLSGHIYSKNLMLIGKEDMLTSSYCMVRSIILLSIHQTSFSHFIKWYNLKSTVRLIFKFPTTVPGTYQVLTNISRHPLHCR